MSAPPAPRVLHVITSLETGGAQSMLLRLLAARDGSAAPTVVSLVSGGAAGARIAGVGAQVLALDMAPGRPDPRGLPRLLGILRELRPAVVQGWMYHANVLASTACAFLRPRPRLLWNIRHSIDAVGREKPLTGLLIRLGPLVSRGVEGIVYNSRAAAEQHEALGYDPARRVLIPNGFDCDEFRPSTDARAAVREELGLEPTAFLVGMVARYHPMKDHATFLRAGRVFLPRHPDAHLVLAGPGVTEGDASLRLALRHPALSGRVHLLGERSDMPRLLASLDIAALTSAWGEGFPNVLGEAMACGVPCTVTDVGDAAAIVGDTGEVVRPGRPDATAAAWDRLRARLRRDGDTLRRAARARIRGAFSVEVVREHYAELYRGSSAGAPAAGASR